MIPPGEIRRVPPGRLWRCTACRRVEWTRLRSPQCAGAPEAGHARSSAEPIPDRLGPATDDRRLFL
jgi:hypothetical protein